LLLINIHSFRLEASLISEQERAQQRADQWEDEKSWITRSRVITVRQKSMRQSMNKLKLRACSDFLRLVQDFIRNLLWTDLNSYYSVSTHWLLIWCLFILLESSLTAHLSTHSAHLDAHFLLIQILIHCSFRCSCTAQPAHLKTLLTLWIFCWALSRAIHWWITLCCIIFLS